MPTVLIAFVTAFGIIFGATMIWLFTPGRIKVVQLSDGKWYVRRRWNGVYHKCLSREDDYWWLEYRYHWDYCGFRTQEQAQARLKEYRS